MSAGTAGRHRWTTLLLAMLLAACGLLAPAGLATASTMQLSPTSAAAAPNVLAQWTKALAKRTSTPVSWVAYGDSITEGQGASSRANRWIDRTLATLRTTYPTSGSDGPAGGVGFLPGWYAVSAPDSGWKSYSARSGSITNLKSGSLGMRAAQLHSGASQTYAFTGTSVDLYYTTGGGILSYRLDGGTSHAVNTAGAYKTNNRVSVTFAGGTHSLKITATSGTVGLEGVTVFNRDRTKGIRLFDNTHSGFTSGAFVAARSDLNPLIKLLQPDLVTIALGANDYLKGTGSPGQLKANLRSEVANLRSVLAAKPPSIVIVLHYNLAPRGTSPYSWKQFADAIRSVVADDPTLGLLDMTSMGTAKPGGYWSSDGLHPNNAGNAEMARLASAYLDGV